VEPIERYTGPFNASLSHPALIIGNTVSYYGISLPPKDAEHMQADPITPLANGLATHARMAPNSSTLVIFNSPGVSLFALSLLNRYLAKMLSIHRWRCLRIVWHGTSGLTGVALFR
jgi:hypothetical protein